MAEIPNDITEKYGTEGGKIYEKGRKAGVEEGKGVSQDPFASEVNGTVTSILNAKKKEGYKAPTVEEVAQAIPFKLGGGELPDRSKLLAYAKKILSCVESMPKPPKAVKKSPETTS